MMKKCSATSCQQLGLFLLLNLILGLSVAYAQEDAKAVATPLQPVTSSEFVSSAEQKLTSPPTSSFDEQRGCQMPTCYSGDEESSFQLLRSGQRFKFSGWVESGLYTNARGATSRYAPNGGGLLQNSGNGPNFGPGLRTTDYNMNQLLGRVAREMKCENGLDWGFQADLLYGMNGYEIQCEESFDNGWGKDDYGFGFYQFYCELGYGNLSARYGKFGTPIGWEETASWDNFFYSHSYCYEIEPYTHTGAMVYYQLTSGLKLAGGWTAGMESSFANRYGDQAYITGLELAVTQKSTLYYYNTLGTLKNGLDKDGNNRFASRLDADYFIQSLCFEWLPMKNWTYVCQYNMHNWNEIGGERVSAYGINNHLLYKIDDKWGVGFRAEWLRDNGVLAYTDARGNNRNSDYIQLTLGLNFSPTEYLRIRPEIRYDHSYKNAMFAYGTKKEQLSGGFAVLYGF